MHLREAREILILEEDTGRLLHLFNVKVAVDETGILRVKRVFRARDIIMIGARRGIKAGMQPGCHLPNPVNHDVVGQKGIHLAGKGFGRGYLLFEVEMGVIVAGMHPRVGTSAARDGYRLSQLQAQASLHRCLHAD